MRRKSGADVSAATARSKATWLARRKPVSSSSVWVTIPTLQQSCAVIAAKARSRWRALKVFESRTCRRKRWQTEMVSGVMRSAPATSGPAQAPRPASSRPAIILQPVRKSDCSVVRRGVITMGQVIGSFVPHYHTPRSPCIGWGYGWVNLVNIVHSCFYFAQPCNYLYQ